MSDPISGTPPPYVPPSQFGERRSGPGCWVWGLLSCLVVVLIGAVLIGTAVYKVSKSPTGAKLFGSMNQAFSQAQRLAPSLADMKSVRDAIMRYHERNGVYPPNLSALSPDYIQSPNLLHAPIDPNPDPSHVSFVYTRPQSNASPDTPLLSFHWYYTLDAGNQKSTSDNDVVMLLDGRTRTSTTQSMTAQSTTSGSPVAVKSGQTTTTTSPTAAGQ